MNAVMRGPPRVRGEESWKLTVLHELLDHLRLDTLVTLELMEALLELFDADAHLPVDVELRRGAMYMYKSETRRAGDG